MPFKLGPLELMLMLVIFLVVCVPLIIGVTLLIRYINRKTRSTALDIAEQRYARGEITETQLKEIKNNLK